MTCISASTCSHQLPATQGTCSGYSHPCSAFYPPQQPEAIEKITTYEWPGNVRELRNAIEYAFVLCSSGGIGVNHLPPKIAGTSVECVEPGTKMDHPGKEKESMKKAALIRALRQTRGNRSETARLLGVSRVTVWKQIKRFKIDLFKDLAT